MSFKRACLVRSRMAPNELLSRSSASMASGFRYEPFKGVDRCWGMTKKVNERRVAALTFLPHVWSNGGYLLVDILLLLGFQNIVRAWWLLFSVFCHCQIVPWLSRPLNEPVTLGTWNAPA